MPNITGKVDTIHSLALFASKSCFTGAFSSDGNTGATRSGSEGCCSYIKGFNFNANAGAAKKDIYRDVCLSVRPKSYGVYVWQRTS